jgi:uncharacterized repeat protein (TIGR02543 family)
MKKTFVLLAAMFLLVTMACSRGGGGGGGSSTHTYVVTYNGNGNTGGSVPVDSTNYENGQTITVLGNTGTLVKAGDLFAGWNTKSDGSGTTYSGGLTFAMGTANVTLYAIWTADSSEIGKWDESTWDDHKWGP